MGAESRSMSQAETEREHISVFATWKAAADIFKRNIIINEMTIVITYTLLSQGKVVWALFLPTNIYQKLNSNNLKIYEATYIH